jgi:hypothetical protein
MWCNQCRQDVPGRVGAEAGEYLCPRCATTLAGARSSRAPEAGESTDRQGECSDSTPVEFIPDPLPLYDGWELEETLRHVERVVGIDGRDRAESRGEPARHDASHSGPSGWHHPSVAKFKAARRRRAAAGPSWIAALTWTMLALGVMALACGAVLMATAAASDRNELWTIGLPIGLGGQIVLLIGLVLQLDRLGHDSRQAAEQLEQVDERLDDLSTTTTLLGTSRTAASTSFYSHYAGGASPKLLLADLKGQLDLLAVKLSHQDE